MTKKYTIYSTPGNGSSRFSIRLALSKRLSTTRRRSVPPTPRSCGSVLTMSRGVALASRRCWFQSPRQRPRTHPAQHRPPRAPASRSAGRSRARRSAFGGHQLRYGCGAPVPDDQPRSDHDQPHGDEDESEEPEWSEERRSDDNRHPRKRCRQHPIAASPESGCSNIAANAAFQPSQSYE